MDQNVDSDIFPPTRREAVGALRGRNKLADVRFIDGQLGVF